MYPLHPRNSTAPEPYKKVAMAATSTDLTPWNDLQAALAGAFEARAQGIVSVEYGLLDQNGRELGRLRPENGGATLEAGGMKAEIVRDPAGGYRMFSDGGEILTSAPVGRAAEALNIRCAGRLYEARLNLFRNTAVATADGGEITRLTGGFAGRKYEAGFDTGAEGAFPIAVLLLHHITTLRRRAYRA